MKKIMFVCVFVTLLFTTSFGYTLTIKNGDYTLVREGIMANTLVDFSRNISLGWTILTGGVTPTRVNVTEANFTMPENDVFIEISDFEYTIIYNGNGATSGNTASSTHTYEISQNLTTNGFKKTGYVFAGWAESADGDVKYKNEQSIKNLSTDGDKTLYAKWINIVGCTVKLNYSSVYIRPTNYTSYSTPLNATDTWVVMKHNGNGVYSILCPVKKTAWSDKRFGNFTNFAPRYFEAVANALGGSTWYLTYSDIQNTGIDDFSYKQVVTCTDASSSSTTGMMYAFSSGWQYATTSSYSSMYVTGYVCPAVKLTVTGIESGSGTADSPYILSY